MLRRDFLRTMTLGAAAGLLPGGMARAQKTVPPYAGPCWLFVYARGAWDPRLFFDPSDDRRQDRYSSGRVSVGNFECADWDVDPQRLRLPESASYEGLLLSPKDFLRRHGERLTVINGLDSQTGLHHPARIVWGTGRSRQGYPTLGAMLAASRGIEQPMSYVSLSGYDETANVLAAVRTEADAVFARILLPRRVHPSDASSPYFLPAAVREKLDAAQAQRLAQLGDEAGLEKRETTIEALRRASERYPALARLQIPDYVELGAPSALSESEQFFRRLQLATAVFEAGMGVCASVEFREFDTHRNHDWRQPTALAQLFGGLDFLIELLEARGLRDRVNVVVFSDFARGPYYNGDTEAAGKDHWRVGSMLAFGPDIAGNRQLGGTDAEQRSLPVDPTTFQPKGGGTVISAAHIHAAIRAKGGVTADLDARFPLDIDPLPLFG